MDKKHTVKAHLEFDRIIRHGQAVKTAHFAIFFLPRIEEYPRAGISVGKKNGMAVRRVKIKRQVRAMIEKSNPWDCPYDFIVVIRPSYDPRGYHELEGELLQALSEMKGTEH